MGWHDGSENNTGYTRNNSQGLLIGRRSDGYYHKPTLRFENVGNNIPAGASITSAKLKLWPKSSGNPANWPSNTSTPVHTRITSDMYNQPSGQFSEGDYATFIDHLVDSECCPPTFGHVSTVYDIPQWSSDSTQQEITVTEVVQEEVSAGTWQAGRPIHFIWYAQDNEAPGDITKALAANKGRVFHSHESDPSKAPTLEITYSTPTVIACEAEGFTLNPNTGENNGYAVIDPGSGYSASGVNGPLSAGGNGGSPGRAIWRANVGEQEDLDGGDANTDPDLAFPGLGTATKDIYLDASSTYYFWARTRYHGALSNSDSSWLKITKVSDGSVVTPYTVVGNEHLSGGAPDGPSDGAFHWVNFVNNNNANIISFTTSSAGLYKIELRVREDGNKIDKIELTSSSSYTPTGYGSPDNCPAIAPSPSPSPAASPSPSTAPSPSSSPGGGR